MENTFAELPLDQFKVNGRKKLLACSQYSLREVAEHCTAQSCWIILWDEVYDITLFLAQHPGGIDILLEHAGRDATVAFKEKGHSQDAFQMVQQHYIGSLVETDRIYKRIY